MRKKWIDSEMILTLGYYLFERNATNRVNIERFSEKLFKITKVKRSINSLALRVANYQSVDPNYNGKGLINGGQNVSITWDKFVSSDSSLDKIRKIYHDFKIATEKFDVQNFNMKDNNQGNSTKDALSLRYNIDKNSGKFEVLSENLNINYVPINNEDYYTFITYDKDNKKLKTINSPIYQLDLFQDNRMNEIIDVVLDKNYHFIILTIENDKYTKIEDFEMNLVNSDKAIIKEDIEYISHNLIFNNIGIIDANTYYLKTGIEDNRLSISFKESFIKQVIFHHLGINNTEDLFDDKTYDTGISFEENIHAILEKFKGKSIEEISGMVGYDYDTKAKSKNIFSRMLSKSNSSISEFKKANIVVKTIRIDQKNRALESMSFPAFNYTKLAKENWDKSELKSMFRACKFLFPIFKVTKNCTEFFGIKIWSMDKNTLDDEVKKVWLYTQKIILKGNIIKEIKNNRRFTNFIGMKDTFVIHVRPHAKNANDELELPVPDILTGAKFFTKQCFWINSSYITNILNNKSIYKSADGNPMNIVALHEKNNIIRYNGKDCPINYRCEGDVCIKSTYQSAHDALFDDVIKNEYFVNIYNSNTLNPEIERLRDKKIIIQTGKNDYITVKYFMRDNISFSQSTNIISLLYSVQGNIPLTKGELQAMGISESRYRNLIDELKINELKIKNEIYLTGKNKITMKDAVGYILHAYKQMDEKQLIENIQYLLNIEVTEIQVKRAVTNFGGYYDQDFNKYFLDKAEYHKYIWES